MADVLPVMFAIAVGLCLTAMLLALWNSLRGLFAHAQDEAFTRAPASSARSALLREKEELVAALRELRFEHELGKVSDPDFQRLDQRYRTRAREVMRELDEQLAPYRPRARALLDQALGGSGPDTPAPVGASAERAAPGCTKCGTRNDADALFCKKCGASVQPEAKS